MSDGLMRGTNQLKPGKDEQLSTSPVKKATGIPCILPDIDFAGVLISACASTYIVMDKLLSLVRYYDRDILHISSINKKNIIVGSITQMIPKSFLNSFMADIEPIDMQ